MKITNKCYIFTYNKTIMDMSNLHRYNCNGKIYVIYNKQNANLYLYIIPFCLSIAFRCDGSDILWTGKICGNNTLEMECTT